jgi:hypothetical protein
MVVAGIHRRLTRPNDRGSSHGTTLLQSRPWHCEQQHYHSRPHRIGHAVLVKALPSHQEEPVRLLVSGAELWLTNVLVFALWYWRLDGGGPTVREKNPELVNTAFVFPQMQIEKIERKRFSVEHWRPGFVDYLFIAFSQSSTFGPTDAPILAHWAKLLAMGQVFISLCIVILLISRAVGVL